MAIKSILFYLIILSSASLSNSSGISKRIFFNDPIYFQRVLAESQDLQRKVKDLTETLSRGESTAADLKSKIEAEYSTQTQLHDRLNAITLEYNHQEATIKQLQEQIHHTGKRPIYIRWGRKTCPGNGTEQVYSGYAGGSWWRSNGGAAEFLCMPVDPLWEVDAAKVGGANVYGTEYEYDFFGSIKANEDVPCSVCRVTSKSSTLMLPGRNQCYDGWTLEYHGWLAAGNVGYESATQFICLDKHPEALQNGEADHNGKQILAANSVCGSLPCPPYEPGKSLSCAVCSF